MVQQAPQQTASPTATASLQAVPLQRNVAPTAPQRNAVATAPCRNAAATRQRQRQVAMAFTPNPISRIVLKDNQRMDPTLHS